MYVYFIIFIQINLFSRWPAGRPAKRALIELAAAVVLCAAGAARPRRRTNPQAARPPAAGAQCVVLIARRTDCAGDAMATMLHSSLRPPSPAERASGRPAGRRSGPLGRVTAPPLCDCACAHCAPAPRGQLIINSNERRRRRRPGSGRHMIRMQTSVSPASLVSDARASSTWRVGLLALNSQLKLFCPYLEWCSCFFASPDARPIGRQLAGARRQRESDLLGAPKMNWKLARRNLLLLGARLTSELVCALSRSHSCKRRQTSARLICARPPEANCFVLFSSPLSCHVRRRSLWTLTNTDASVLANPSASQSTFALSSIRLEPSSSLALL